MRYDEDDRNENVVNLPPIELAELTITEDEIALLDRMVNASIQAVIIEKMSGDMTGAACATEAFRITQLYMKLRTVTGKKMVEVPL